MPTEIRFYRQTKSYGEFSNFYPSPITIEGAQWYHVEGYFQAMKSRDPEIQQHIRAMINPAETKKYGRIVQLRDDWDNSIEVPEPVRTMFLDDRGPVVDRVKDHFMYQALVHKFAQHESLRNVLVGTDDAYLIEATPKDAYWGIVPSGEGLNKLGRMLMLLRKRLQIQPA